MNLFKGFIALTFATFFLSATPSSAVTFSGSITLPSGVNAGSTGASFEVGTQFLEFFVDGNGFIRTSSDTVNIPPFGTTANFSFELPPNPTFDPHTITFDCESGCNGLDVTTSGFWSESLGVVGSFLDATEYSSSQNQNIDIVLESADVFSGTISLPEGFVATGNEQMVIRVRSTDFLSFDSYVAYVYPDAGETHGAFVIGAPSTGTTSSWEMEFLCNSCDADIEEQDHFPTTAGGNPPTLEEVEQFIFPNNVDYANMSLTLISNRVVPVDSGTSVLVPVMSLLLDDN